MCKFEQMTLSFKQSDFEHFWYCNFIPVNSVKCLADQVSLTGDLLLSKIFQIKKVMDIYGYN
jgi:hypothetical protein